MRPQIFIYVPKKSVDAVITDKPEQARKLLGYS